MLINALSIATLALSFLLGIYVYLSDRANRVNRVFILMLFAAMFWIFANFMANISTDLSTIDLWSKLALAGPLFVGYFFYRLSILFPRQKAVKKAYLNGLLVIVCAFLALVPTSLNVVRVYFLPDQTAGITPGPLYIFFLIYFILILFFAFRSLFRGYRSFDRIERLQVQYIAIGLGISIFLGSLADLVLPIVGDPYFVNYGPYFVLVFIVFTSYAIIRYKLFDIKILTTQLVVFSLWIFVFIRMLISPDAQDTLINGSLLLLLIIFGIFLIRSVMREVSQREKIEKLAADLEKANVRLTELDRQKSEFVSFATHQLRAPLTAMKGYASLIMEGDMGVVPQEAREAVSRIFESANTLTSIVDDYLNITRIELGSMKYAFDTVDLRQLVEDVIAELKPNIEKSKLTFSFEAENSGTDYRVTADRDKLKQVIANLIDNSIKYTPQGFVKVSLGLDRPTHKFVFKLADSGVGIAPETLPRLFQKFSRAENANKTNIRGTGLGLFVAKEIINAHHGAIRAESPGEGKGSTFIVELEPFAKA